MNEFEFIDRDIIIGGERIPLRQYFAEHDADEVFKVATAKAMKSWHDGTKYCCGCGAKLEEVLPNMMKCPQCGREHYPRISPCIIVVIQREDGSILLAKHHQRNQDIYALIAGFVEGGETLEHAVEREIMEETGITVTDIKYYGSQSWPFPDQLMIGFTCRYVSGEITLQRSEIDDARWFTKDNLPNIPKPGSISYELIANALHLQ